MGPVAPGLRISTLKRRRQFVTVARRGRSAATAGLVVQVGAARAEIGEAPAVGYTASRKVGGAVERNRAKRRLRALARQELPGRLPADRDYVLIARAATVSRPYARLRSDLARALRKLGLPLEAAEP